MKKGSKMHPLHYVRVHVFELTQVEYAKALGVSQQTVSRWDTGKADPPRSSLMKIRDLARKRKISWDDSWFFVVPNGKAA